MKAVNIEITRLLDSSSYPEFVEARLIDAHGVEWRFKDKLPIFTAQDVIEYPEPGVIGCEVERYWQDASGKNLATINTEKPWGVESSTGHVRFDVAVEQLCEI